MNKDRGALVGLAGVGVIGACVLVALGHEVPEIVAVAVATALGGVAGAVVPRPGRRGRGRADTSDGADQ